ncbi:glycosyl transferase [Pseudonocardia sulfidoxydans NBRC 16205]|uniref:Glycosyl transferase n=1 Tax=Pseudonocardia sulfidoxydans NBRC 16205 TaxID=1223511 RepID=A0A511DQD1_9PSEU|nr:glycosyltransferase [Pseudonocardia sulfidoxydans]GEL25954.1 glycosyl transferase [Pseudonocardia sulfidoxydans NBRC 16205]
MRILVVAAPLVGHLLPMLPMARTLAELGHEVVVASGGDALGRDLGGLPAVDVAQDVSFARSAARTVLAHPRLARRELAGEAGTDVVGLLFGAVNEGLADAVVAVAGAFEPEVVVHEPLAPAGALAAARIGVPAVLQENSLYDGPSLVAAVVRSPLFRRALRRHGLLDELPPPADVLTIAPPSVVGVRGGRPMRSVPDDGAGLPDWLTEPTARPRILVSRSTVAGPGGDPMAAVVAAAPDVDAEIVLVRPTDRLSRKSLPPNVRTVGWVPLSAALPHAAAVVHHGGAGTVLTALATGTPQLVVPGPGDRRHNADLVARRGAGLSVAARSITAASLSRLVTDTALHDAAREVRAEIAAMPDPAEALRACEWQ